MEQRFVKRYVDTGDAPYAAAQAGYAQPSTAGAVQLAKPGVLAEVKRQQTQRLIGRLLPLAFDHYERVLTSTTESTRDKTLVANNVGKLVVQFAEGVAEGREAHEMSGDELAAAIGKLRGELDARANRAKDITPKADDTTVFD